jgi:multidrug efflux pump
MRMMPAAERNQFAVEIYLPSGTSLDKTAIVADSLEHILRKDPRVVSIASFKGTSSPRFQTSYAPQFGGPNYAQFIVNTTSPKATLEVLAKYRQKYQNAFPAAYIKFKELEYGDFANPIEVRISGSDWNKLKQASDTITKIFRNDPNLELVRNDVNEPLPVMNVKLDEQENSQMGITNIGVEIGLASRYNSDGLTVGTVWQGDYDMNVRLKGMNADNATPEDLKSELIPVRGGLTNAPLRQIADVKPAWQDAQIAHRNGIRTITVMSEVTNGVNVTDYTKILQKKIKDLKLDGASISWGGEADSNAETLPSLVGGLSISVFIIFMLMLFHFKNLSTAMLLLFSLLLTFFGMSMGIFIPGGDFTLTCFLGLVSLMGILVRNAIIMYDYAEELRETEHLDAKEAIMLSAKRRMRPIFLTSAAASMGVLPMIMSGSGLWAPMGNVIFYGTIITMFFILTVLPIAYWRLEAKSTEKRLKNSSIENL